MKPHAAAVVAVVCGCTAAGAPPSRPAPHRDARFEPVVSYLESQVDSAFPGAVLAVGHRGDIVLIAAVGRYGQDDRRPVTPETIYDLASLTKVIGLTTASLLLAEAGRLDLDAPVQRYVPAFAGAGKERVTVRHLLTHSSGLPAWRPLYTETTTRAGAFALADSTPLLTPPGDTMVYSDLGAIVLTQVVEGITGERLDAFLDRRLFAPLQMTSTRYLPPSSWQPRIAPTERSQDGTIIRGTVHDENAWRLGGVSGHAGLFSSAPDLARFATWLLARWRADSGRSITRAFTRRQGLPPGSSRALGWDTPSGVSSGGTRLGPNAFGHTGFTGTSIWIDPDRDLFIILLSNRVHPTRENARILRVRPRVADLVVEALAREAP
ncbi:MAG: serine hydrolase domain-containing protein [Gemmatimonadales bacterium]|nr:serine hydrolase domain-containing protein [Gemmatimonadales bacterium]